MRKSIIVAAAQNGTIGKDGQLPWRLPNDLKRFKELTMGHYLIMGRKTYESLPPKMRPLPGRTTIVLTRAKGQRGYSDDTPRAMFTMDALDAALETAALFEKDEVFICGGGEVYKQALPLVDRVYLTVIERDFEGDTFFPFVGRDRLDPLFHGPFVTQAAGGVKWQCTTVLHVNNENGTRARDSKEPPYRFEIWDRA